MPEDQQKDQISEQAAESEGSGAETSEGSGGNLTSPEGILMLAAAGTIDALGMMIALAGTWIGIDDYGVLDIFGLIIIGGWMYMRSGQAGAADAAKKGLKRFITATGVELVPFLGGVMPSWTILVYRTLKNG